MRMTDILYLCHGQACRREAAPAKGCYVSERGLGSGDLYVRTAPLLLVRLHSYKPTDTYIRRPHRR